MSKKTNASCSIILFLIINNTSFATPKYHDDRIMVYINNKIIDFRISDDLKTTNVPDINNLIQSFNARSIKQWLPNARPTDKNHDVYLDRFHVIYFGSSKNNIDAIAEKFKLIDAITISEKVAIVEPAYVPNDSLWDQLYGLSQIKADLAFDLWDIDGGEIPGQMENGEIVVAIPDIGLKWSHPDLIDNIWQNLGEDLDGDGVVLELIDGIWIFDPDDENGVDDDEDGYIDNFIGYDVAMDDNDPWPLNLTHVHGTKVAGNVSAVTNNGIGLSSVGYSVKLMGLNANSNINEPWYLTHTNEAVLAAAQMGADIINCSWVSGYSNANNNFFQIIHSEYGSIVLGAAGNGVNNGGVSDTTDFNPRYPAGYENVLSVTALGAGDSFNCWSNVHETVDISAPGEFIICAYTYRDTLYALGTGTSYATPLTAGAIALVKSLIPNADNETVISKILNTAGHYPDMIRTCGGQSIEGLVGSGQLNIHRAVLATRYPELLVKDVQFQTDDGFINPGETITINVTIQNSSGFEPAEDWVAILSTDEPGFDVIDNQIQGNGVPLLESEEFTGQFIFTSNEDALLGDIPFNIQFSATSGDYSYESDAEILVPVSLGLIGFPIENVSIHFPPTITDLDGNNYSEIYFDTDSLMHGKWLGGSDFNNFPFNSGSNISTGNAVGDLDGDGNKEIVFGTSAGVIYVISDLGVVHMIYEQEGSILDVPVLSDLDQDGDVEIIFTSNHDSGGVLYAIHDTGDDVSGFPINVSSSTINSCPSIADIESDGLLDIIISTRSWNDQHGWSVNIHAIDGYGALKEGFPFSVEGENSSPVTLIDLDNDNNIELVHAVTLDVMHSQSRILVWGHEGEGMLVNSFETEGVVHGGISVSDMDGNGSMELVFTGDNEHIHAWDPILDTEPTGWPLNLGSSGISEPIIVDVDNDGDLEIMCVSKSNEIHFFHHDGTNYNNFPYISQDSIYSTPAIGDLDNDGDHEVIVGTLSDLRVIDITEEFGDRYTWSSYRGNMYRDGYFDATLVSIKNHGNNTPDEYFLYDNYPNPFNPITKLSFVLPKNSRVSLTIFDTRGIVVKTLLDSEQVSGKSSVNWDGRNEIGLPVSTGLYFYRIEAEGFTETKKMILLK